MTKQTLKRKLHQRWGWIMLCYALWRRKLYLGTFEKINCQIATRIFVCHYGKSVMHIAMNLTKPFIRYVVSMPISFPKVQEHFDC